MVPHDQEREWKPFNLQICDPVRPTTVVSGGPGRRRWEFMRLPHETMSGLNNEETAWRLLARWELTPDNAELERHTVYTFQARWADAWRRGRVVIAGDAAHLMPPFAGQGMCSGIRDCANLAWKLDLVLSGRAGDALLDTYTSERSAHIQNAIGMSVELGNVICLTDPAAVAARDEVMLKAEGRPRSRCRRSRRRCWARAVLSVTADGGPGGIAGQLSPQGLVRSAAGTTGLFDQVTGTGFVLLGRGESVKNIDESARASLAELGAHVVRVPAPDAEGPIGRGADGTQTVIDVDGRYQQWLDAVGYEAVVIRPDYLRLRRRASAVQAARAAGRPVRPAGTGFRLSNWLAGAGGHEDQRQHDPGHREAQRHQQGHVHAVHERRAHRGQQRGRLQGPGDRDAAEHALPRRVRGRR